jgi:hypothetical protein
MTAKLRKYSEFGWDGLQHSPIRDEYGYRGERVT